MKKYDFYLNDSDELCCAVKNNNIETILENMNAKMQLKALDAYQLKHVQITSRNIVIELSCGTLTLRNYKEILNEETELKTKCKKMKKYHR